MVSMDSQLTAVRGTIKAMIISKRRYLENYKLSKRYKVPVSAYQMREMYRERTLTAKDTITLKDHYIYNPHDCPCRDSSSCEENVLYNHRLYGK